MCQQLALGEMRQQEGPGPVRAGLPAGAVSVASQLHASVEGSETSPPTATGPGALPAPPSQRRQGHRPVAGAVTRGSRSDRGQEVGAWERLRGSGDLRVVRIQGLLLAEAGWSPARLGFCPPTPVLVAPRQSSGSGPLPGAGLCQALASGPSWVRWSLPGAGCFGTGQASWCWALGPSLEAWPVPGWESSGFSPLPSPPRVEGPAKVPSCLAPPVHI